MEKTSIENAQKIMGENFIGPAQLARIGKYFPVAAPQKIPAIPFSERMLKKVQKDYILILGTHKDIHKKALTLNVMRDMFGIDPAQSEPCFYNQDWYLKEKFAHKTTLQPQWYLLKKTVDSTTRAKHPDDLGKKMKKGEQFPLAILCAYTFFAYYFLNNKILWEKDFIWCNDMDANGDRIYVGRYKDPKGINKNGFNIHRHLSIKKSYGLANQIL